MTGRDRSELKLRTRSPEETSRIGRIMGETLAAGDVVALVGDLGSGKTCLTQGIAQGLGVPEGYRITSPTFTLINEYPGRIDLCHMDMYRIAGSPDAVNMGTEEYFSGRGVAVVEWAEKIADILPEEALCVRINYIDEDEREFIFSGSREYMERIADALAEGGFGEWR